MLSTAITLIFAAVYEIFNINKVVTSLYGFCFLIVDTIFCFAKNGIIELRQRYIYNKQIKGEWKHGI